MEEKVSLINLKGGAAIEAFDVHLGNVLKDLMDPNKTGAQREISLIVKFKPVSDMSTANITIDCRSKMAPDLPVESLVFLEQSITGDVKAFEHNPKQKTIPEMDNVTPMKKEAINND